jgi:hypothetical protein
MIHWLTTQNDPRAPGWAEPVGWKMHALEIEGALKFSEIKQLKAVCGLIARHGWGLDLFIEDRCKRCEKILKLAEERNNHGI